MHSEGEHTPNPTPTPGWAHRWAMGKLLWWGYLNGDFVLSASFVFLQIFFELLEWGSKRAWKDWIKYVACQGLLGGFLMLLVWSWEREWKDFTLYMLCEQSSIIFFHYEDDILLHANFSKYVKSTLSTIVCALWRYYWCYFYIMWAILILHSLNTSACILNSCEYICFSSLRAWTPFYSLITLLFHALGVNQCFQAFSYKYRYINKH